MNSRVNDIRELYAVNLIVVGDHDDSCCITVWASGHGLTRT